MRFYPFEYHEKKLSLNLYLYSQLNDIGKFLTIELGLHYLIQAEIQSSKCLGSYY